ncbi:MAG TPA: hypothetical protein VGX78_09705 [Pirellulales bacterium]|nr:hypothetical protein [Pirellulales bacterium]
MFGMGPFELLCIASALSLLLGVPAVIVVVLLARGHRSSNDHRNPNLVPCIDCGRLVSPQAASCPQCGRPLGVSK